MVVVVIVMVMGTRESFFLTILRDVSRMSYAWAMEV